MYLTWLAFRTKAGVVLKKNQKLKTKHRVPVNAGSGGGPGSIFLFLKECCFRGRLGLGFVSTLTQTLTLKQHSFFLKKDKPRTPAPNPRFADTQQHLMPVSAGYNYLN